MVQPPLEPLSEKNIWEIGDIGTKIERPVKDTALNRNYYVDAAIVNLNNNRNLLPSIIHSFGPNPVLFADRPLQFWETSLGPSDIGRTVLKFGGNSLQRLEGFIENPDFTGLSVGGRDAGSVIVAKGNQSSSFSICGDSGSALVAPIYDFVTSSHQMLVVGLCFGVKVHDGTRLYACHFSQVIKALGLEIPPALLRKKWRY